MMGQLGITRLRPGPSGNEADPHHANYDETLANPYPQLPDALLLNRGARVTTAEMWYEQRRPEIVQDFENEVYGCVPDHVPAVTWTVTSTRESTVGETPVLEKELAGTVDNSACPSIEVKILMTVATPQNAAGPVPLLMMFGKTGFRGGRGAPTAAGQGPGPSGPFPGRVPSRTQQLIEAGWGYATIDPSSIQADNGAGLTRGIIGLVNQGQPRKPNDWGALRVGLGCRARPGLLGDRSASR